jgi:hypothetical protein
MSDPLAIRWRKSSHSDHQGGNCVELACLSHMIGVRDSKDPDGPKLAFPTDAWSAFIAGIKAGVYSG